MSLTGALLRPWSISLLGGALGSLFYSLSGRYRGVALRNLRRAYNGEMSEAQVKRTARQVFRHFTRGGLEFFYLLSLPKRRIEDMMNVEGIEHVDAALERGRGCIVITAHYGNWELMARRLVILGYKVNVIARDSDDPGMTGITTRIREGGGYRVFDRDEPIIGAFRALKRNECLGILPDQNESGGIFVDFFGRPVATAVGPAVLSLRSGAPMVPMFSVRMPDGRYKATAYPAIEFDPTGNEEEDIRELMTRVNQVIEREVRRHPDQWLWFHDRWKLSPEASSSAV